MFNKFLLHPNIGLTFVDGECEDWVGIVRQVELGLGEVERWHNGRGIRQYVAQGPIKGGLQLLKDLHPVEEPLVLGHHSHLRPMAAVAKGLPRIICSEEEWAGHRAVLKGQTRKDLSYM